MTDALLANLKNGALEGAWNATLSERLAEAAAHSLKDSGRRRQLLQVLLQAVANTDAEDYDVSPALCTAFGMSCSNMGADVAVYGAAAERAVLLCGFAGGAGSLRQHTVAASVTTAICLHAPLRRRLPQHALADGGDVAADLAGCASRGFYPERP